MRSSQFEGCHEGCVTCCDEFDRANSTDLGSDWCEQSGDWEIADGKLVGNCEGVAVYTRKIAEDVGKFVAIIVDVQLGCVYQVLAFQGTRQNPCEHCACWILELAVTGGSAGHFSGTLSLRGPDGETACEQLASIGSTTGMSLLVGPERIQGASEASYNVLACRSSLSGTFFAVGSGGSAAPVVYSSVQYTQHYSENTACPQADVSVHHRHGCLVRRGLIFGCRVARANCGTRQLALGD